MINVLVIVFAGLREKTSHHLRQTVPQEEAALHGPQLRFGPSQIGQDAAGGNGGRSAVGVADGGGGRRRQGPGRRGRRKAWYYHVAGTNK